MNFENAVLELIMVKKMWQMEDSTDENPTIFSKVISWSSKGEKKVLAGLILARDENQIFSLYSVFFIV